MFAFIGVKEMIHRVARVRGGARHEQRGDQAKDAKRSGERSHCTGIPVTARRDTSRRCPLFYGQWADGGRAPRSRRSDAI